VCPNDAISAKWYLFRVLPLLILGGGVVIGLAIWGLLHLFFYIF
jgi:hypothetical protein